MRLRPTWAEFVGLWKKRLLAVRYVLSARHHPRWVVHWGNNAPSPDAAALTLRDTAPGQLNILQTQCFLLTICMACVFALRMQAVHLVSSVPLLTAVLRVRNMGILLWCTEVAPPVPAAAAAVLAATALSRALLQNSGAVKNR